MARQDILRAMTQFVFVTGYSDEAVKSRVRALKPAAYLVKPITPDHVKSVIAALFDGDDQVSQ